MRPGGVGRIDDDQQSLGHVRYVDGGSFSLICDFGRVGDVSHRARLRLPPDDRRVGSVGGHIGLWRGYSRLAVIN